MSFSLPPQPPSDGYGSHAYYLPSCVRTSDLALINNNIRAREAEELSH